MTAAAAEGLIGAAQLVAHFDLELLCCSSDAWAIVAYQKEYECDTDRRFARGGASKGSETPKIS